MKYLIDSLFLDMKHALKTIFWSTESGTIWLLTVRAGWILFQRLWVEYFWLVLFLMLVTFVTDSWLFSSVTLVMTLILLARPTVTLQNIQYLLFRQTTVCALILGIMVSIADHMYTILLRSAAQNWIVLGSIAGFFKLFGIQAHYVCVSPFVVMTIYFLLDAPLSLRSLGIALQVAIKTCITLYVPLMLIYLVTKKICIPVVTALLARALPLQVTLFIAAALVMPWYIACCAQWYIRSIRKGFVA